MKSAAEWIAELEQGQHSLNERFVCAVQLDAHGRPPTTRVPGECGVCEGSRRVASYEFSTCLYCLPEKP